MAKTELDFAASENTGEDKRSPSYYSQLSDVILKRNILWFMDLRIIVIAVLAFFGILSLVFSDYLFKIGIVAPGPWPFGIAVILLLANLGFRLFANIKATPCALSPAGNIWLQIIIDLLALTAVVHYTGSTGTPSAFLYIIHIALSCIFFNWKSSLKVTLLASALYISCVFLEFAGILPHVSLLRSSAGIIPGIRDSVLWTISVIIIFLIVWYIVSRLSSMIQMREKQLISIQDDLQTIQKTKDQYAIQMTHQLKSPLDAMRSTLTLITQGYYGDISKDLKTVMERIEVRAKGMGDLILDVLRLARLLDPGKNKEAFENIDLARMLTKLVAHYKSAGKPRGITFDTDIKNAYFNAVPEQILILLTNLISNAVNYSFDGGTVKVKLYTDYKNAPVIIISDKGIGIPEEKLPNIFNEYFKTKEAMKHNPASTGIGLSMVRRVAEVYKIHITVESELKKGTTFTLRFPMQA